MSGSPASARTVGFDSIPPVLPESLIPSATPSAPIATPAAIKWPHVVSLPESYEPNYAYPLIVWFHSRGRDERELFQVLPEISERNYIGLALRGTSIIANSATGGRTWVDEEQSSIALLNTLLTAIEHLSASHRIHPGRITLAGADAGATLALRLLLMQPTRFAGAIHLGGGVPKLPRPLANFRELHRRRVFFAASHRRLPRTARQVTAVARLLHTAGMQVKSRVYPHESLFNSKMLRDLDRWLMDSVCTAIRA